MDGRSGDSGLSKHPDWMSKLHSSLTCKPLTSLAIPGSHDSFAYNLDKKGPLGPDCTKVIRDLCKIFGPAARQIIYRWSTTQSLTLTEQLEAGIRYFDLRVSSKPGTDDLYFIHGLYGSKVMEGMAEINEYLNQHPKEVVLLDLNHFYSVSDAAHARLRQQLQAMFDRKLCPQGDPATVTLQNLWDCGQQVLLFYHDDDARNQQQFWPGSAIPSPWGNTTSRQTLLDFLQKNFRLGHQTSFYVNQGVLTPDAAYVVEHFPYSLKSELARKIALPFIDWIRGKSIGNNGINVCILDFVEMEGYIEAVIDLNLKEVKGGTSVQTEGLYEPN